MSQRKTNSRLRLFFMRGLGALLPTILTIFILVLCYRFVRDNVAQPINFGIHRLLINTEWGRGFLEGACGIEFDVQTKQYRVLSDGQWHFYIDEKTRKPDRELIEKLLSDKVHPIFGFLIGIMLIFLLGFLLATYVGRRIFRGFEEFLVNIPVIKFIYPHAKQLVQFFFKEKKMEFSTVVAIEYPRKGLYSLALLTGEGLRQLHGTSGARLVSVFIPSSPMPMTGYTIFVPYEDVIPLELEVDEALRLVVTGGVVVPDHQLSELAVEGANIVEHTRDHPALRGKDRGERPVRALTAEKRPAAPRRNPTKP
jgi:uncharacterized membrane protein